MTWMLGKDNHFSGEIWFSVMSSGIAAVPGIVCGVLALVQTQKLHEMEARYHRPSFGLQGAEMEVVWIWDKQYCWTEELFQRNRYVEWVKEKGHGHMYPNLLALKLDIEIKNDVTVENIVIEEIRFQFVDRTYILNFDEMPDRWKQYRRCRLIYQQGKYLVRLIWELYPYTLTEENKGNVIEKDIESRFWKDIELFTNYENRLDMDYQEVLMRVTARVYYEYAPKKYEIVIGRIAWDVNDGKGRNKAKAKRSTCSGVFTYRDYR